MAKPEQLTDLAGTISEAVEQLNGFYNDEALELRFPGGKPTNEQGKAVSSALQAALKLQRMLMGPVGSLMSLAGSEFDLAALHVIHDFEIAKHVPMEGTITMQELAIVSGIPAMHLTRILRHAMTNRIFTEPVSGSIAHTQISRRLAHDPLMRATVSMLVDEQFPASACFSRAMQKYGSSSAATDTAWALANDAQRPMVDEMQIKYPQRAEHFAAFMKHNWSIQHPLQPLIDNYDWGTIGEGGHVVDVGGGMGHASIALAKAFPSLKFTVQDFKTVTETGEREFLEESKDEESLKRRVKFLAHDAFNEQPIHGADVYLFRSVFHDWPDESCVTILRRLVPALKHGSVVLINDYVMPEPGELGLLEERRARTLDLIMTSFFNAREREAGEWGPLFEKADARFRFEGVHPCSINHTGVPTKKLLSIIKASWTGQSPKQ